MNDPLNLNSIKPINITPPLPSVVAPKIKSGASTGLWVALIAGTILLMVSFFLAWYYFLRQKYIAPRSEDNIPPDALTVIRENNPNTQTSQPSTSNTNIQNIEPCPNNKSRSEKACKMCMERKYANCKTTYCKCK